MRKTTNKPEIQLIIVLIVISTFNPLVNGSVSSANSYNNTLYTFSPKFNATRTYNLIEEQLNYGPRIPGSKAIESTRKLIKSTLSDSWTVINQNFTKTWTNMGNIRLVNVVCYPTNYNNNNNPILLMSHYDSRLWADHDPDPSKRNRPVPGANDGASSVAVVLELGKILVEHYNVSNVWLIFFDAEDQGNINGWDWIIGSEYFAKSNLFKEIKPSFGILLDMVGAENATFKREGYSEKYAHELVDKIWSIANLLNYDGYFINKTGRTITDDHLPLIKQGLPVVDIIDEFGTRYTPWHTTHDNITFININTLQVVGNTLEFFLSNSTNVSNIQSGLTSIEFKSPLEATTIFLTLITMATIKLQYNKFRKFISKKQSHRIA